MHFLPSFPPHIYFIDKIQHCYELKYMCFCSRFTKLLLIINRISLKIQNNNKHRTASYQLNESFFFFANKTRQIDNSKAHDWTLIVLQIQLWFVIKTVKQNMPIIILHNKIKQSNLLKQIISIRFHHIHNILFNSLLLIIKKLIHISN